MNNYYGPTTVYQGSAPGYSYDYSSAQPAYYSGYGSYGAPWCEPFVGGVGYSRYGNYGGG